MLAGTLPEMPPGEKQHSISNHTVVSAAIQLPKGSLSSINGGGGAESERERERARERGRERERERERARGTAKGRERESKRERASIEISARP